MKRCFILFLAVFVSLLPAAYAKNSNDISVLLLGTDNLGQIVTGNEEDSRADAIFILTLLPEAKSVRLLSVERDYLVTLPGDLGRNKIGTATFFGGPQMCMEAVNDFFDINILDYVQINLSNLVKAVDMIGGIDVEIYDDEVDPTNEFISSIPPFDLPQIKSGLNHLDGNQVWAFMGNREMSRDSVSSNQQRNTRQMRAITAGMEKIQQLGVSEAVALVDEVMPLIKTNISLYDILSMFVIAMESDLDNLSYLYSPSTSFSMKTVDMHRVVILDDEDAEKQIVSTFLYN